jgi:hypothetical protein
MPSRTVRRYRRKHLARIDAQPLDRRSLEAARILGQWRADARERARSLGAPAVWALVQDPDIQRVAQRLDPSGELYADLNRVCAEAVAEVAGRHLVRGSRPLADRSRRESAGKR